MSEYPYDQVHEHAAVPEWYRRMWGRRHAAKASAGAESRAQRENAFKRSRILREQGRDIGSRGPLG